MRTIKIERGTVLKTLGIQVGDLPTDSIEARVAQGIKDGADLIHCFGVRPDDYLRILRQCANANVGFQADNVPPEYPASVSSRFSVLTRTAVIPAETMAWALNTKEDSITTLTTAEIDGNAFELRVCGTGPEACFEWVHAGGDPLGSPFYHIHGGVEQARAQFMLDKKPPFNDSAFRVRNIGDSTYYRPTREAADRAACECLQHYGRGCHGVIEAKSRLGWSVVARFQYGGGIVEETAASTEAPAKKRSRPSF